MKRRKKKITITEMIVPVLVVVMFLACGISMIIGLSEYEYRAGSIPQPVGHYSQATGQIQEKPPMPE